MKTSEKQSTFWKPRSMWLLGLPIGAIVMVVVGILATMTFNGVIHATNDNAFCYGCHVGMDTIVEEYEASVHGGANPKGFVASCSDCHVPKEFFPKMLVKIKATKDIYHQLLGTYNLENFESHRTELATAVRDTMKSRDSKECRNCHNTDIWDFDQQSDKAQQSHNQESWIAKDKTCISCHLGLTHNKPR